MNIVFTDLEFTWGTGYNLKQQSYSEYLQHPKVELTLATWCTETSSIHHATNLNNFPRNIDLLVCHNTMFDAFMLKHRYEIIAKQYFCTMRGAAPLCPEIPLDLDTLAKVLGLRGKTHKQILSKTYNLTKNEIEALPDYNQYIEYGKQDTATCREIFKRIYPRLPNQEKKILDLTIKTFLTPHLALDIPRTNQIIEQQTTYTQKAIKKCGVPGSVLRSSDQFAEYLANKAIKVPLKQGKNKLIPALAQSDFAYHELQVTHPELRDVWNARNIAQNHIVNSKCKRLQRACINGNQLPSAYTYWAAHTGRWGGTNKTNLQALPRKDNTPAGRIRSCLLAPDEDHVIVVADQSQMEKRIVDFLTKADLTPYYYNEDPYIEQARKMFNKQDITKQERFLAKVIILAIPYGLGAKTLRRNLAIGFMGLQLNITEKEADQLIQNARTRPLRLLWEYITQGIETMHSGGTLNLYNVLKFKKGAVQLPSGIDQQYVNLQQDYNTTEWTYGLFHKKKIFAGLCLENLVQRINRDITAEQALNIDPSLPIAILTHDEIGVIAHKNEANEALEHLIHTMSQSPSWATGIPVNAEGTYDYRYAK